MPLFTEGRDTRPEDSASSPLGSGRLGRGWKVEHQQLELTLRLSAIDAVEAAIEFLKGQPSDGTVITQDSRCLVPLEVAPPEVPPGHRRSIHSRQARRRTGALRHGAGVRTVTVSTPPTGEAPPMTSRHVLLAALAFAVLAGPAAADARTTAKPNVVVRLPRTISRAQL